MGEEKKPEEAAGSASAAPPAEQAVAKDALTKSNEELGQDAASETPLNADGTTSVNGKPGKKLSPLKKFLRRFNIYLLLFLLIIVVASVVSIVGYLNGKKQPKAPTITNQTLTQDQLKQLANSDATVGDTGQTLTVQGNAIFSGQVLVRSNLNVAGTIQLGSTLSVPSLTVSGKTNLADTQINSLQVAVPNHVAFTGASPGRTINFGVLGAGGSASVNGSDMAGTVNINTGSGPAAGCFVTLTFSRAFTATPHVTATPIGAAAGQMQWYINRSTTSFSICTNTTPPINQAFAFDYFITG
jgi:hypothetical protein